MRGGNYMNEVPNIISTKDLAYIEDMLNWNLTLIKKIRMYKSLVNDSEIKRFCEKVIKSHTKVYQKLLTILE